MKFIVSRKIKMYRRTKVLLMVFFDILIINISLLLSFLIRWEWSIPKHIMEAYYVLIPFITIGRILIFNYFELYKWSFRYASLSEALRVLKSMSLSSFIFVILVFFLNIRRLIGRAVPIIDFLLCLFFILSFRFILRFFFAFAI